MNCGVVTHLSDLNIESEFIANKVLIIDNLDSFAMNIAHVIAGLGNDVCVVNGKDKLSNLTFHQMSFVICLSKTLRPVSWAAQVNPRFCPNYGDCYIGTKWYA